MKYLRMSKEGNLEEFNVGGWDACMVIRFDSIPWFLTLLSWLLFSKIW